MALFRAWAILGAPKIESRKAGKPKTADPRFFNQYETQEKKRQSTENLILKTRKTKQAQKHNESGTGSARKRTAARHKKKYPKAINNRLTAYPECDKIQTSRKAIRQNIILKAARRKGYTMNKNSIRNLMKKASEKVGYYEKMPVNNVKVTVSDGNMKIGRVLNFSKMPGLSCGNCSHCLPYCYDMKACAAYPSCLDARCRNYVLMLSDAGRDRVFDAIAARMTNRKRQENRYYRHDVGGELMDIDELERLVLLAKIRPNYKLWTYTKMHALVNLYVKQHGGSREKAIPKNLIIMFSEWDGMPLINPYGFPIFTVKMKNGNKNHKPEYFERLYKCPGNCDLCKPEKSYDGKPHGCIAGEDTYNDEH